MKESQMFELVESWKKSGLTRVAFLKDKDISLSKFGYWIQRYKRSKEDFKLVSSSERNFHEVHLPDKNPLVREKILELTTNTGTHLVIYG